MESLLNREDHGVAQNLAMHIQEKYDMENNHDSLSCKICFIDNLIREGHNVLIFSQTRLMLNLIQDTLDARGYKFLRIDGTTKSSEILKIVNDFQKGVAPIFLLTTRVGGLGLTLTKADRVIVVDPAWNRSVDRSYRIGQKKYVIVYRLMTCGTVEEIIYRKHRDSCLQVHIKFLESLGIGGTSHHSFLFSKTAPVPAVQDYQFRRWP
ncbi:hypothetical protein L2E82_45515 [Cichorium intybus]|uniref:Uncharacterized protein n=1 Tax=Cichorium intybus TaxID=13427 RepID=A0ACB8ZSA8_CICIN|nr:hypothetical protein L2E82_45515 [Cichorium intybus]